MYDLLTLCRKIHLPAEVTELVLSGPEDDELGFLSLREQLLAACKIWESYQKWGIPEDVYIDTMGCFTRHVQDHVLRYGCLGFEWADWTAYQTGGRIFRIGQLEYELEDGEEKQISLHVPAGADLRLPQLRSSWEQAKALIGRVFPEYRDVPWVCHSWLLSPDLKGLLPEASKILRFQKSFVIQQMADDGDYEMWIYPGATGDEMELPEDTALQLNLKYFLLAEFPFHSGRGVLIPDPFRE